MKLRHTLVQTHRAISRWKIQRQIDRVVRDHDQSIQDRKDAILRIAGPRALQQHQFTLNAQKLDFQGLLAKCVGHGRQLNDLTLVELKIVHAAVIQEIAFKIVSAKGREQAA